MPHPELLAFFRTNTKDLPETVESWFQLPNKVHQAFASLKPGEFRERLSAGEDIFAILISLGVPGIAQPAITVEAEWFIGNFVSGMNNLIRQGKDERAIGQATKAFEVITGQFKDDELTIIRMKIYEARALAQGHLLKRGSLKPLPFVHKLRGFCALSLTADLMRADLESGQITDRAKTIAEGFSYAGMSVLQRKAVEKWASRPVNLVYHDTLEPVARFSTPNDSDIRRMQIGILARLISNTP